MMKEYLVWFILFFILLVTLISVKNNNFTSIQQTSGAEYIIVENNSDLNYAVYAKYPQFKLNNLNNYQTQIHINQLLIDIATEQITSFKNEVSLSRDANNYTNKLKFMLFITHTTEPTGSSIISVPFEVSIFNATYRSKTYNLTFNYDILEDKMLMLEDLFKPDSDYLQILSKMARDDLKKQFKDSSFWPLIEKGTEPEEENFKIFSLNTDSLFLFFNSPQVAPPKGRTRVVRIYLKDIQSLFKEQYLPKLNS